MKVSFDKPIKEHISVLKNIEKQTAYATSKTINDLLFGIKAKSLSHLESSFDRPNMNFLKSSFIITKSTKSQLLGTIAISDVKKGKGSSPLDVLGHQINPSKRSHRRFEKLMKRNGLMGSDMYAVPGKNVGAGVLDQYGGISGKFASWIISYFGAYDKAGFKANMTDKKKKKIHSIGTSDKGYRKINGVMYFMSAGHEGFGGKRSHLQAGIWKKSGTHGVNLEPVILFFNSKNDYSKRFDFYQIAQDYVNEKSNTLFKQNFEQAMATAR